MRLSVLAAAMPVIVAAAAAFTAGPARAQGALGPRATSNKVVIAWTN